MGWADISAFDFHIDEFKERLIMGENKKDNGQLFDICVVYKFADGTTRTFVYRGIKDYSFRKSGPFLELTAVNGEVTYIPYEHIGYMSVLVHGVHDGTPAKMVKAGVGTHGKDIYIQEFDYLKEDGAKELVKAAAVVQQHCCEISECKACPFWKDFCLLRDNAPSGWDLSEVEV